MYKVRLRKDTHPIWLTGFLKLIKKNPKSSKKVDMLQLFDKAKADAKEREAEKQRELRERTEEVAKMFQEKAKELLKDYENTRNPIIENERRSFGKYGYAQNAYCSIDDEKFKAVYDFSDAYHTSDVRMSMNRVSPLYTNYIPHFPRDFAHGISLCWEYLEKLLEDQNIKISRVKERKEEKISEEDSWVTVKDIITVTVSRQKNENKAPVIFLEKEKVKTKRESIFSNLLNKKTK